MSRRMSKCACGHPVRVEFPKGETPPDVSVCHHCDPATKK